MQLLLKLKTLERCEFRWKSMDQPHQTRQFWNCTFFQEMGAEIAAKKMTINVSW